MGSNGAMHLTLLHEIAMNTVELSRNAETWIGLVGSEPVTAAELVEAHGYGPRPSAATIRKYLNAGVAAGLLTRRTRGHGMRTAHAYRSAE